MDVVFLMPKDNPWTGFMSSLDLFSEDYMEDYRNQPENQEREKL